MHLRKVKPARTDENEQCNLFSSSELERAMMEANLPNPSNADGITPVHPSLILLLNPEDTYGEH
jgi:hypothetical protein